MEEKITFQNSKGLKLISILHTPEKKTKSIIVMAHGFTGGKEEWGLFTKAARTFCKEGFAVFRFDFGGCGESEDTSLTVDKEIDDLKCAIKYVKKKGFANLGLLGLSLGGLISVKVYDEKIKTMILWAPVTDKVKYSWDTRYSQEQLKELKEKRHITKIRDKGVRKKFIIDKEMLKNRENVNQKEILSQVKCSVLIIHGNKDNRVPLEDSKNAIQYLPEASELKIIQDCDHHFTNKTDKLITFSLEWFKKHLHQ